MLEITTKSASETAATGNGQELQLVLTYAQRCRSRLRATTTDGTDIGLRLPRDGEQLRAGDLLMTTNDTRVRVVAAVEPLYAVTAPADAADPGFCLLRGAYHLGNRHVPLELAPTQLKLERDPVLKDLLLRLGLVVTEIKAAFQPEAGAYGGGHRHDHDHHGGSLGEQLSREAHHHGH